MSNFIAFIVAVFSGFGQFKHLKLSLIMDKVLTTIMRNPELVLSQLKVHSASHTLEMLKYFKFCDPARQKLTSHLRLLAEN